ncbi:unnamed protein product [Rangifer tarandus platyrhynchus]|uniref:Uncharacterized protein n=1 Tax=Rangifer tarandus platyrhynchus TaxID=3082113 RepID=A0AC59YCC2_RANTA
MATHSNQYSCLGNPQWQRSLESYSPWGCKESDMTGQLSARARTHTHTHTQQLSVHTQEEPTWATKCTHACVCTHTHTQGEPTCQYRRWQRLGLISGSGRSFAWGRHANPLQYSCLENPTDRGTWWVTVHGVAKSPTQRK